MSLNSLTNKGVVLVTPRILETQKTIVVVGVARGGTSIVAGSLSHLGIFMGNASDPVFEDMRLSLAFEKQSKEKFESVIADYNQKHELWAWKRPSSLNNLPRIAKKLRNPHFVFVFRDLLSVANRNKISMKHGVVSSLDAAFNDYKKIVSFIKKTSYPTLLVSSEKAVKHKKEFIDSLIDFAGLKPTSEQVEDAHAFISPEPASYLKVSRIDRVTGWIDKKKLQTGLLTGWAYKTHDKTAVNLSIYVNEKLLKTISSTEFNSAFKGEIHPTGQCSFSLNFIEEGIKPSDLIEVRPEGSDLNVCGIDIDLSLLNNWLTSEQVEQQVAPQGGINHDLIQLGLLRGWARTVSPEIPAFVSVYVNGKKFAMIPAVIFREHFKQPHIHPTGKCGFELNLKQLGVLPSDIIEVCVDKYQLRLHPEPIFFPEFNNWLTPDALKQKKEANINFDK